MIKKTITTIGLTVLTFSAFASNVNNLSEKSTWDEIKKNNNIEISGDFIKVGNVNTTVFFVEEADGKLYTKKPISDGYYEWAIAGSDNKRKWIDEGESIKTGDVTIKIGQYERKRINRDRDERVFVGYKEYTQPLTRELDVYEVRENSKGNKQKRFLFKKEYTVNSKV